MTIYERDARQAKVSKLLSVFRKHGGTVEDARSLTDEGWADAAKLANVKLPSAETRRLVIEALTDSLVEAK